MKAPRIPIAIVAHPKRNADAIRLAAQTHAEAVCWDIHNQGAEVNHLAAWEWLGGESTRWGVVLEDDVIPCKGFQQQLAAALENSPTPIVSLYLGRGRPPHWQQRISRVIATEASYITAQALLGGQGYAMRTELFHDFDRVRHLVNRKRLPIDEAISAWAVEMGIRVSYPVPSLVDHRDGPTLIRHWDGPRNGLTALLTDDSDPSGALLPEIRKAWLFGPHAHWDSSSLELGTPLTTKKETHGDAAARGPGRRLQGPPG